MARYTITTSRCRFTVPGTGLSLRRIGYYLMPEEVLLSIHDARTGEDVTALVPEI